MTQRWSCLPFVTLTFSWSWAFFIAAALASNGIIGGPLAPTPLIVVGAFGPTTAAFVLTCLSSGSNGVRGLLSAGFRFDIPVSVAIVVSAIPLIIAAIGQAVGGSNVIAIEPTFPLVFIVVFFLGGSFGEEFGWRGFLLPRLLEKRTAFVSSLILAAAWSAWHLPLFWIRETSQYTTPFWLYTLYVTALTIQYTWVYMRTRGNLLACLLLHTFTNLTVIVFPLGAADEQLHRFSVETCLNAIISASLVLRARDLFFNRETWKNRL